MHCAGKLQRARDFVRVVMRPTNRLLIQIADVVYAVTSADPALKFKAEGTVQDFVIRRSKPDISIKARLDDLSNVRPLGKMVFDSGTLWQLYQDNGTYTFSFKSDALGPFPYRVATVDKDFKSGEVLFHRPYFEGKQHIHPLEYPLDELLFINHLALAEGIEVHACGVVDSYGKGHLFPGQSGAGKTTTARLWQDEPGITILSDDRIILRKIDNRLWMYGTPWHGEAAFAAQKRAPLKHIYFLEKGERNQLLTLRMIESMGNLFTCSFPPFYNRRALDSMMSFLSEVVSAIPCYELRFLPDKRVVEFVQQWRH